MDGHYIQQTQNTSVSLKLLIHVSTGFHYTRQFQLHVEYLKMPRATCYDSVHCHEQKHGVCLLGFVHTCSCKLTRCK